MDDETKPRERRLADVVREMKIAEADRLDAADREGEIARRRLELLADELSEVFEEAGGEEAGFDFQISPGPAPRLWIDAATHVALAHDGETFRVMRDARGGRTLLGETSDVDDAADIVTRYIATRSLERERLLDENVPGAAVGPRAEKGAARPAPVRNNIGGTAARPAAERVVVRKPSRFARLVRALLWFALGALVGAALLFVAYGERLGFGNPVPSEYRQFYEPYVPATPGDVVAPEDVVAPADAPDGTEIEAVPVEPVEDADAEPDTATETAPDVEIVPVQPVPAEGDAATTDG